MKAQIQPILKVTPVASPNYYDLAIQEKLSIAESNLQKCLSQLKTSAAELLFEHVSVKDNQIILSLVKKSNFFYGDTFFISVSKNEKGIISFAPNKCVKFDETNAAVFIALGDCYMATSEKSSFYIDCISTLNAIKELKESKSSIQQDVAVAA